MYLYTYNKDKQSGQDTYSGTPPVIVVRELFTNDPTPSNSPYLCLAQTGHLYCKCKDIYCERYLLDRLYIDGEILTQVIQNSARSML